MSRRNPWRTLCLVAAILATPAACLTHAPDQPLQSNAATVQLSPNDQLLSATSGAPYTGTLIARDAEILPLAQLAFRGTPAEAAVASLDPNGLILELPVAQGQLEGQAILHADLRSPKLSDQLQRIDPHALELARAIAPTLKIGQATFQGGRLEGPASLWGPGSDTALPLVTLAEASFHHSVLHGSVREYAPGGGQLKRDLNFDNGVRSGQQRRFYPSGALERQSTFVNGVPHGVATEYYADGNKRQESTYEHGTAVGKAQAWFPSGQLQREVVFVLSENGAANGTDSGSGATVQTWRSNGALASTVDAQGNQVLHPADGEIETFYPSGALRSRTQYAAGVQHGPFEVLYSDGKRWESGRYENGKRSGPHKKWWKNGRLALASGYSGGELDGEYKRWYATGVLWEQASYAAGKRQGRYQKWWKNGAVAHDYRYVDGKLDGEFRTYYDSGARWAEGLYVGGKPQGTLKRWFPDGRLGYIKHHRQGRGAGAHKRWYADGTLRLDATYVNGRLDGDFKNWLEDGSVYEFATYRLGKKLTTTLPESAPS